MTLSGILKHKGTSVAHVTPAASIAEVTETLNRHKIGAVLVCDEAKRLLGVVSERDVVRGLVQHGGDVLRMTASQLMTRSLRTATPTTGVLEAMALMTEGRFRHLPVVEDGQLVGIVSIGDVVKARIEQQDHEVDSLRAYVAGAA